MSRWIHRLYSRKSGTPSVIFLAGMGDSGETWKIVQDRISQEASTLSYDRAGIGRSPAPEVVSRTCRDLVEELYDLLQEIKVETPCILVGHSFGGLVARLFASLYPQLVSGLVLVDAAPEYKELAYEKVLPDNLIAANRDYYENPMRNSEKIDKIRSYQEIVDYFRQSDIPVTIITRGLPDVWDEEWPNEEILAIDQRLQANFTTTSSKQRIATRSGHYIHHDEPEMVIEEILIMVRGMNT
ncbi:alpha/beta hydrolase [Brevibacillus sp. M2.1A]|uniref:alpha/beta fold hydrolase n=1 Tax=Brevibacillus TaxID=55080 RepID=UPI00156B4756|nr:MULTISPECIES: alpha/beta hydrolase [Brevibacillus]MBY0087040.1 alpha/beta hydrolase [Brevibacillus brevis]MCC8438473.1 alpha/beta hydrolase [Brevibacillus sp. M2.1A]